MGSQGTKIVRTSKMASADIQQFIKEAISQDKVVVFSKSYCPYCDMAKEVRVKHFARILLVPHYELL